MNWSNRDPGAGTMDMLVKLYTLPDDAPLRRELASQGITIRRAMAYEKLAVLKWVKQAFGSAAPGWASECDVAFSRSPIACYIAVCDSAIVGFACHDCTSRNFLGPIGVAEGRRRSGVGKLLLLTALRAMHAQGYEYAIVGQAGAAAFFANTVAAAEIPQSEPGVYPPYLES